LSKLVPPSRPQVEHSLRVGAVYYHTLTGARGVVVGWDERARAPREWLAANLPGKRSWADQMRRLCAAPSVSPQPSPQRLYRPSPRPSVCIAPALAPALAPAMAVAVAEALSLASPPVQVRAALLCARGDRQARWEQALYETVRGPSHTTPLPLARLQPAGRRASEPATEPTTQPAQAYRK